MKSQSETKVNTPTKAELERRKIMEHRMSTPVHPGNRDHATNWNRGGLVKHTKRENMLGEGIGNCLGLDSPKYHRSYGPGEAEAIEEADIEYKADMRFKQSLRKQFHKTLEQRFVSTLPDKAREGKVLVNQRVFLAYPKPDWDIRAANTGGLPKGVDIAKSDFGYLLIAPVVEAEKSPYKDPHGRPFQIEPTLRETIHTIFGAVKWTRPLTLDEVKQFGIEVE